MKVHSWPQWRPINHDGGGKRAVAFFASPLTGTASIVYWLIFILIVIIDLQLVLFGLFWLTQSN